MGQSEPTKPVTICATKESNAWQIERIRQGIAAARAGKVRSAENVFSDIAANHDWRR